MHIHIITIVWGEHHARLFLDLTLPNVLSPGNLPALCREHDVTYRFFTTPETRDLIAGSPGGRALASQCSIEYETPLGDRRPDVSWHVHWFHRSAAEGKRRGAAVVFVPPDTLWSDGAFARMGELLDAGKTGIACPFVIVSAETCGPEVLERFLDPSGGSLIIGYADMADLVSRHMHPLQVLGMAGGPHARPAFEIHYPVAGHGLISRYAVRELVAFDPARCPISFLWYADMPQAPDAIHFAAGPEEMLMLSVDPLSKYFQNYIVDHGCSGLDLARTTRHPLNDTPFTALFADQSVEIGTVKTAPRMWDRARIRGEAARRDVRVGRVAMLAYEAMMAHGAQTAAGLLAAGIMDSPFLRRWRAQTQLTAVVPLDTAFSGRAFETMPGLKPTNATAQLAAFLKAHILDGPLSDDLKSMDAEGRFLDGHKVSLKWEKGRLRINGAAVMAGPLTLEDLQIVFVDTLVRPDLDFLGAAPTERAARRFARGLGRVFSRIAGRTGL